MCLEASKLLDKEEVAEERHIADNHQRKPQIPQGGNNRASTNQGDTERDVDECQNNDRPADKPVLRAVLARNYIRVYRGGTTSFFFWGGNARANQGTTGYGCG